MRVRSLQHVARQLIEDRGILGLVGEYCGLVGEYWGLVGEY